MKDLHKYLNEVRERYPKEIVDINHEVSHIYELTAYYYAYREKGNPILFFHNIAEFSIPIVQNLFGTWERVARIIGASRDTFYDAWLQKSQEEIKPKIVSSGPVKEIHGDNVGKLPIPKYFETDGGRYITSGIVVTKDPENPSITNLSFARLQLKNPKKFGASFHSRGHTWSFLQKAKSMKKPLDVAVFIGGHPVLYLAAASRSVNEYNLASGILGNPLELVKCETVDLEVPANAEIVIEGIIKPDVEEKEGPFTEYTGYATGRSTRNVIDVTHVSRRSDAIYVSIVPANSEEHLILGGASRQAKIFRVLKEYIPSVIAVDWPLSGVHFICFVSVKTSTPGLAKQVGTLILGLDPYVKMVVVVDETVNVYDEREVLHAIATKANFDTDFDLIRGSLGHLLDPASKDGTTGKIIIDATGKGLSLVKPSLPKNILEKVQRLVRNDVTM